jgi:hypothetical protein
LTAADYVIKDHGAIKFLLDLLLALLPESSQSEQLQRSARRR